MTYVPSDKVLLISNTTFSVSRSTKISQLEIDKS